MTSTPRTSSHYLRTLGCYISKVSNLRRWTVIGLALLLAQTACGANRDEDRAITSQTSDLPEQVKASKSEPKPEQTMASSDASVPPAAPSQTSQTRITVDDMHFGTIITNSTNEPLETTWKGAKDAFSLRFSGSKELHVSGIVDLKKSGPIRRGGTSQARFRTRGMKHPAMVLRSVGEGSESGSQEEELVLLDIRTGLQLFRETVERRDADGGGGFSLRSLRIETTSDAVFLRGTHQDHLPSRRSRCLKPTPYPVAFRWQGSHFAKQPRGIQLPSGGC